MKIQDLAFILIFLFILWRRNARLSVLIGLFCLLLAIPLFKFWIFFTAERLTWYAGAFFVLGTVRTIPKHLRGGRVKGRNFDPEHLTPRRWSMKIGIDISQIVHEGTGGANYTKNLVENLLRVDKKNRYILFGSSLRKKRLLDCYIVRLLYCQNVTTKIFPFPPLLLEFLWNRLHIFPIEWFIGEVDVFLSSDWLQPLTIKAKKVTTIHDLIVFKYQESFKKRGGHDIVANQKRRLRWVKKECDLVICDSEATKKDVMEILKISEEKLKVVYPGGV